MRGEGRVRERARTRKKRVHVSVGGRAEKSREKRRGVEKGREGWR